jgi:hypothetical protein
MLFFADALLAADSRKALLSSVVSTRSLVGTQAKLFLLDPFFISCAIRSFSREREELREPAGELLDSVRERGDA